MVRYRRWPGRQFSFRRTELGVYPGSDMSAIPIFP